MRTKFNKALKSNSLAERKDVVQRLNNLTSLVMTRAQYGQRLGQSFGGDRDLYEVCGYPTTLTWDEYYGRYERDPLAGRIVEAFPNATWSVRPDVFETDKANETQFEKDWDELQENLKLFYYFTRADILAGIGQFSVIYLGFDDGKDPKEEVSAGKLVYVQVYGQGSIQITKIEENKKSPRYGKPVEYTITPVSVEENAPRSAVTSVTAAGSVQPFVTHWSRIIHVADHCLDNDVYGQPRLQRVWNRLQDIETVCGGSAEMFWRAGYPGLQFVTDPDAQVADESALETEIEEYVHGLSRYLRLQGMEAKSVPSPGSVSAPYDYFNMYLAGISAATGIPVRILVGSERGELASSQDERGWRDRIKERRSTFATDGLLRPFVQRLIDKKAVTTPKDGDFKVDWPPVEEMNETEKMNIANMKIKAVIDYVNGGADALITPKQFLMEFLGYTAEEAEDILIDLEKYQEESMDDAANAAPTEPPVAAVPQAGDEGVEAEPEPTAARPPSSLPPPAEGRRMAIKNQSKAKGKK